MFGLNAHFSADSVYIDERAYKPNEVLTFCLNLSMGDLEGIVSRLLWLRGKVQLPMGGDQDCCGAYDGYVQEAQNLFHRIGNLALKIPIYKKRLRDIAGIARLAETLDTFPYWHDSENEHFKPDVFILEDDNLNIVLAIKELNEHVPLYLTSLFSLRMTSSVCRGDTPICSTTMSTPGAAISAPGSCAAAPGFDPYIPCG